MAGFDDAALGVVHQDGKPSAAETIDAGEPGGIHLIIACSLDSLDKDLETPQEVYCFFSKSRRISSNKG